MDPLILIVTFAFLGYAIKYIDQAYDEQEFSIRSANLVAITAGLLGAVFPLVTHISVAPNSRAGSPKLAR